MKKKIAVLAVATALSAAALGTVAGAEESKGLIGVAMPTQDLQRWNQDGENMKAELADQNAKIDYLAMMADIEFPEAGDSATSTEESEEE